MTARGSCSRAVIPLPKTLSRKIARFFDSKIGPATGVTCNSEEPRVNSCRLAPSADEDAQESVGFDVARDCS